MEREYLKKTLICAARTIPPDGRVPHGFERRVMARLEAAGLPDEWILWSRALWRAAVPCVVILVIAGVWAMQSQSFSPAADLAQQIENAVLSELNQNLASVW